MPWQRLIALGDSFTEGLDDPQPDGSFRGWADLLASAMAAHDPGLHYANLAVRGRLLPQIVATQVPAAMTLKPDLVTLAGGGNDILRRRLDLAHVSALLLEATEQLRGSGADVLLFTGIDPAGRSKAASRLSPRVQGFNAAVRRIAEQTGSLLVDLGAAGPVFDDERLFSPDRLHLNDLGHDRVARAALQVLGYSQDDSWREPLPPGLVAPWVARRAADARWMRLHAAPWVHRRLTGRSTGDDVPAKRPVLGPLP